MAIQEKKNDKTITSAELLLESYPYNVYRKDRNFHGGGVTLLTNMELPHMALKEMENDSESVWVKVFANRTSHYIAKSARVYKIPVQGQ